MAAYSLSTSSQHLRLADRDPGESTADIALVLIDDHRLLRDGLTAMMRTQPGLHMLASTASVDHALECARAAKADVVLLDIALADHDSLALTATLRLDLPDSKVIVMGLQPNQDNVAEYIRAGVSGFIMRDASFEEFFDTIREVVSGAHVLPKPLATALFVHVARNGAGSSAIRDRAVMRDAVHVTSREREVIDALAEGLSNKEIALRLQIAVHTVKSHVHNVLEKLNLNSRLEVAAFSHAASRGNGAGKLWL